MYFKKKEEEQEEQINCLAVYFKIISTKKIEDD
jgi:hypothetical protein